MAALGQALGSGNAQRVVSLPPSGVSWEPAGPGSVWQMALALR